VKIFVIAGRGFLDSVFQASTSCTPGASSIPSVTTPRTLPTEDSTRHTTPKPWATIRGLRRRFDKVSLGGRGPVPHPAPDFFATVGSGCGLRSPAMESALCSAVWPQHFFWLKPAAYF